MTFQWRKACLNEDNSILDALGVIDHSAAKAAFVMSEDGKLQGLVTDGDIRRGLLSGVSMDEKVSAVMNRSPLTCEPSDSPQAVRRIMEAKQLMHMPVVDEGRLVNVLTLQELIETPKRDNPVFLMAGGYGSRLRPLTDSCPKPLLQVGSKPILETILENFAEVGFHRFFISTHYLPEMIKEYFGDGSRWGVSIEYTYEDEPLGTAGALGLLPDDLPDLPLIMMNGDILTKVNFSRLLKYHTESNADATMCVREHEYQVPYGVVQAEDFKVQSMHEKPVYRYYINAGIYVINPALVKKVRNKKSIDMPTLLNENVEEARHVGMYPLDEYWLDIGRMNDFEQAQQDIRNVAL